MKIYLSKSNSADKTPIAAIKEILLPDVTILEYTGGPYNPELILSSDIVFVFPPKESEMMPLPDEEGLSCYVGKGQYGEIDKVLNHSIYVIHVCKVEGKLIYREVIDIQETGINDWQHRFAAIIMDETTYTLEEIFGFPGLKI